MKYRIIYDKSKNIYDNYNCLKIFLLIYKSKKDWKFEIKKRIYKKIRKINNNIKI